MLFLCRLVATLHCRFLGGAATVVLVAVAVAVAAVPLAVAFVYLLDSSILHVPPYYRLLVSLLIFRFSVIK